MEERHLGSDPSPAPGTMLWKAVARLPADREEGLASLERCFAAGSLPTRLDGLCQGRVLTTTFGRHLDALAGAASRAWMPWKGKTFDAGASEGRNIFTNGSKPVVRLLWPGHRDYRAGGGGRYTTFRFVTHTGPSKTDPQVEVLRIDYGHPGSPRLVIRSILDELVQVEPGLYLGQALLRWKGNWRRAAWFSLEQ